MKVLYIQPGTPTFAGIERVVDTICSELADKYGSQLEMHVLYTTDQQGYPTEPRRYHAIKRLSSGRLSLLSTFRSVVRQGKFDVVVVPQVEPTVLV